MKKYDIIVVGAGISGATLAELYARKLNKKVLVVENRSYIGGNCHDFTNDRGVRISKHGPHYFHTNDESIWEYVKRFSDWIPYEARVMSYVDGKKVPIPINIDTVNNLLNENLSNGNEMRAWLEKETKKIARPANSEEVALSRFGPRLYEKLFKHYTEKQWDKDATDLEPGVIERIPIRHDFEDRYFTDKYQMYPTNGYNAVFARMLSHENIEIRLNTNWNNIVNEVSDYSKLFFTGRIDTYFREEFGRLEYRSLHFAEETIETEFFQETIQVNYPGKDFPFTRIVEFKHQTKQAIPFTTITREYPTWDGEPYYPVPSEKNRRIYEKYQAKAVSLEKEGVYFVGRLANYKYFNMDQAFRNALDLFESIENGK